MKARECHVMSSAIKAEKSSGHCQYSISIYSQTGNVVAPGIEFDQKEKAGEQAAKEHRYHQ